MANSDRNPIAQAIVAVLIAAAAAMLFAGCARYTRPVVSRGPQGPAERTFEALWQGSLEVLRKYRFEIDRRDRRAGMITTEKMLGRHWFEFWRHDAVTWEDLAEGTVQTVYRQATVRIVAADGNPGRFQATVVVKVFRPQRQGKEIIAAGEAYDDFLDTADEDDYRRARRERDQMDRRMRDSSEGGGRPAQHEEPKGGDNLARKLQREIRAAAKRRLAKDT